MHLLTIVVCFLEIHVHNTTGPDLSHGVAIKGLNFSKLAGGDIVATILGEEDRNRVVGKLLGAVFVSRFCVGRGTTPRVNVVSPEVDGLVRCLAVEVVGHVLTDSGNVSSGISDTHRAVALLLDVLLHVPNSRLDEGTGIRRGNGIGYLITCEETNGVVVLGQLVDDAGVTGVKGSFPRGIASVNGLRGVGQIRDQVDTSL
jgi:hypothetical protein